MDQVLQALTHPTAPHAFLIIADEPWWQASIPTLAAAFLGLPPEAARQHPDVWSMSVANLALADALAIRAWHSRQPLVAERKLCALWCASATPEANHALLKTLEEPAGESRFLFGTVREDVFLPTVRSRCRVLRVTSEPVSEVLPIREFLDAPAPKRLALIETFLARAETAAEKRALAARFLRALEHHCATVGDYQTGRLVLATARDLAGAPSVPGFILEQLALVLH